MNVAAIGEFLSQLSFRQAVWMLPGAFALHVLEEAPQFTAWVNRYASPNYTRSYFWRVNLSGLSMTLAFSAIVSAFPSPILIFLLYALVIVQGTFFNPLFHAGATAAFGTYSPGLLTSLIIHLPLFYFLSALMFREGLLSHRAGWAAFWLGGGLHAAVVARTVFWVPKPAQKGV